MRFDLMTMVGSLRPGFRAELSLVMVLGLVPAVTWGQVIESVPPSSAPMPNPFAPRPAQPQAAPGNSQIIQPLPGTEPAQPPANGDQPLFADSLTADTVQQRMKAAAEDQALDKSQKDKLQALYDQALADLAEAAKQEAKAAELAQLTQAVPTKIEEAKRTKQSLAKLPKVTVPLEMPLSQLEQELTHREESLAHVKKTLDEAINALKNITATRGELSQSRKTLQDRLAETEQQLKALPNAGNTTPQSLAERTQLRARWQLSRATLSRLDKEDAYRQARTDLLPLERDIAALEAGRWEREVDAFRKAVAVARQAELDRQKAEAEAQAKQALTYEKYPTIGEHADFTVELTELRQKMGTRIPKAVKDLDSTTNRWKALQDSFKQSQERVEAAGSTMNVGTLLRLQQEKLPNVRSLEAAIQARQDEIQQIQLASYEINDRTKELANVAKAAEDLIDSLDPPPNSAERVELLAFVAELLETEKAHLDQLNADYNELIDKLWHLDKVERQLIEETKRYGQFISEHVLWIKSTNPLWDRPAKDYEGALAWLLQRQTWVDVLAALVDDIWNRPGSWLVMLAVFGLLFIQQRTLRGRINEIGKAISRRTTTEFKPTRQALVDTVLIAMLWPGILCWVGFRMQQQLQAPATVSAMGSALFGLGLFYFPVELLRQSCRTNGLVQTHFTWPAPVVTMIRRNLRWFKLCVPPLWLVCALMSSARTLSIGPHESLGRLAFVLSLLLEALFMHRVLRPSGAAFRTMLAQSQGGWLDRLKYVFYAMGVLVPLSLASLAIVGYYYTAGQLIVRFYATAILALTVIILDALVQRWLLVTRRRLAMEKLRQRREAALLAQAQQAATTDKPGTPSPIISSAADALDERLDVTEMNDQTRQLVRSMLFAGVVVGLWGIWVNVLPALAILKNVKIHALTIERVIEEPFATIADAPAAETPVHPAAVPIAENPPETKPRTIHVPITLADLMLAIILLLVAIGAARNLPGMLEMIVLQRLPIDNAARYAITTLAQYALMIIGITASFYVVGLRWQNVQWLAAALMLGLGFGLQEIFANFFSGLIVLLERPVRVGDIVTVANTTGIVSKIRMRATTITNWERQEMIIPNKELMTGTVLNWTLSDTIQRVFIQVGVAYGSDTEKATQTLYRVVKSHPNVLQEPAPAVTFAGIGNSTLNFEVRCFLPTAAIRLATTHELHMSIDKAFREAGIEFAIPQCDLHVRSFDAAVPFQQIAHGSSHRGHQDAAIPKRA